MSVVEKGVVAAARPTIGKRPTPTVVPEPEKGADGAEPKKSGKKRAVILVVVAVLALGAGYWFLLGPGAGGGSAPKAPPKPVAGEVQTIEAVSINLAGGHYLRLGVALQLTTKVAEAPDPAKALDIAIALYSGRSVEEVSTAKSRERLKSTLADQLAEAYEGEVMGVFFTDYVTQ